MKPYRLINASELQMLTQHFNQILHHWSEEYCIKPLSLQLTMPPKNYHPSHATKIDEYALIEGEPLSLMNEALFGENKPCFNSTSQELFLILLNSFFKTEQCRLQPNTTAAPDWFYAGSTSLLLTLHCNENSFTLILNPQWVYQQLPKHQLTPSELNSVEDALTKHIVSLSVELIPSTLSLNNLASIQVGDVLTTKHPLTTPLKLTRGKELFAHAELGQSAHHKSILLKRST